MIELLQVRRKAQVTLPASIRRALDIEEGDFLAAEVKGDELVLRVKKLVDKSQAWFWTRRWQEGELEAEQDIVQGKVNRFPNAKEAVSYLRSRSKQINPDKDRTN